MMLMLTMSDNTASLWLQSLAGTGTRINQIMDSLQLPNTKVNSRTPGRRPIWEVYGWGQTTPREMATLFERIYKGEVISRAASDEMLRVLNRTFGADFDLASFQHRADYDSVEHRIEMHLVATRAQTVHLPGAPDVHLHEGETIRTEISCKYDRQSVADMFSAAGLRLVDWREAPAPEGQFALCLGAA